MLYFSLLIAMILLATSYLLYHNTYANQISHLDGSLYVIMNSLVHEIEEKNEKIEEEIKEVQQVFKIDLLYVSIVTYNTKTKMQTTIAKSSNIKKSIFAPFDFKYAHINNRIIYKTLHGYRTAMQLIKIDKNMLQLVQTAVSISFNKNIITTLIFVNVIIFLFFIVGSYMLISKTLLPVDKVVENVNEIKAYDYTKRVNVKNIPIEIKALVETFNKLLTRHQESFNKISQFSSDASHELKTPLTSMRGEIEVGLRRERNVGEYQKIMKKSLLKIMEIQELVEGLLFLAKSDKLEIESSFEEIYIDEIITECKQELERIANKKFINLTMHLLPLTIKGDNKLLKIACINILKNAIIYSPKGTEIKISIEEYDSKFIVTFQDQGVGIAKEDIEYVFDRFYRADKLKSPETRGTGLGLSIVKMILDIHGFKIAIKSEVNKGTIIKIFIEPLL